MEHTQVKRGQTITQIDGIGLGDRIWFKAPWDSEVDCVRTVVDLKEYNNKLVFITDDGLTINADDVIHRVSEEFVQ